MKLLPILALTLLLFAGCKDELSFETKNYVKKSSLPCAEQCPQITLTVAIASKGNVADTINKTVFAAIKEIIAFGEKQYSAKDYDALLVSFIESYEKLQKNAPDEVIGWEGEVNASVVYRSPNLINVEIKHYTFTGGAHGYSGKRSLIFNAKTGNQLSIPELFSNPAEFKKFAEKQFRKKYNIDENAPINEGGLMFENEQFELPATIFFTESGLLLYYNAYEIASYAEGAQELLIPYGQADVYLKVK